MADQDKMRRTSGRASGQALWELSPRMRQIAEIIYSAPHPVTIREIQKQISDDLTIFGLRTLTNRMIQRGLVCSRPSGRHRELVYLPVIVSEDARSRALSEMVDRFFDGSGEMALAAAMRIASGNGRSRR